jgi:tRNA U55 pseudouridine synthase TruB
MQVPPSVSALHVEGMRSYELVRQGMAVELPPRPAHYSSVELQELRRCGDTYRAFIAVDCGQGTYIRALVRDIGREIGCGATMSFLLRTRSGLFELSQAITLEELAEGSWTTLKAHLQDTGQTLARYGLPTLTVNHGRSAYQRGLVLALGGEAPADLPEKNLLLCDAESHVYFGLGSLLPNRRQVNIERMF